MDSTQIRTLNDNFRSTFVGGRVTLTCGVDELPTDTKARLILAVQSFNDCTQGDDPYGEHDFGAIEMDGERYFWKVDLYEEPSVKSKNREPVVTRVLTIMLAQEY